MSRRSLGLGLMVAGGVVALVGLIGTLTSGGGGDATAEAVDTTAAAEQPVTTVAQAPTVSTTGAARTAPSTTTTSSPTTSSTTTTTVAIDEKTLVDEFVTEFASAIEAADTDFLFDTLHPAVLDVFDDSVCRSFIQNEILLLVDYRATGDVRGPTAQAIAGQDIMVFTVPVAFTFQGQDFESDATFAVDDGVRWFTECR